MLYIQFINIVAFASSVSHRTIWTKQELKVETSAVLPTESCRSHVTFS